MPGPELFLGFWEEDLLVLALLLNAMVSAGSFSSFTLEERLDVALFT